MPLGLMLASGTPGYLLVKLAEMVILLNPVDQQYLIVVAELKEEFHKDLYRNV
jgi:hypothetical protein